MDKAEIETILILRAVPRNIAMLIAAREEDNPRSEISWTKTPISDIIGWAFVWYETPDGGRYWSNVYNFFYEEEHPVYKVRDRQI